MVCSKNKVCCTQLKLQLLLKDHGLVQHGYGDKDHQTCQLIAATQGLRKISDLPKTAAYSILWALFDQARSQTSSWPFNKVCST